MTCLPLLKEEVQRLRQDFPSALSEYIFGDTIHGTIILFSPVELKAKGRVLHD